MPRVGTHMIPLDVETTGLDAHGNHLLEVAAMVADRDGNIISDEPFHAVIRYEADEVAELRAEAGEFVEGMHEDTGLWDRLPDGMPLAEVDQALTAYVQRYVPEPDQAHIVGNSVRLDMNFIDVHLPLLSAHLHYRLIDVSTLAILYKWKTGIDIDKGSDHTAYVDILESMEELRMLYSLFAKGIDMTDEGDLPRATTLGAAKIAAQD